MRFDIACLGEPLFEFNQAGAGGDYRPGFGGDVSNCAIAAARQGARVAMVTAVGCDSFGDQFLDLWRGEGIDTGAVRRDPAAPTGLYFITHGPGGHQFDYRRAGSAASRLGPDEIDRELLANSAFLHVSAISQAIGPTAADAVFAAMETVRAAGGRVAYDTNLRLKLWPLARAQAIIGHSLAMVDIALPGMDDARLLTGLDDPDAIVDWFLARGVATVALTLGSEGVVLAAEGRRARLAGHKGRLSTRPPPATPTRCSGRARWRREPIRGRRAGQRRRRCRPPATAASRPFPTRRRCAPS